MKSSQNIIDGAAAGKTLETALRKFLLDLKENITEILASYKLSGDEEKRIATVLNEIALDRVNPSRDNKLKEMFDDLEKSFLALAKTFVSKAESDAEAAEKAEAAEANKVKEVTAAPAFIPAPSLSSVKGK